MLVIEVRRSDRCHHLGAWTGRRETPRDGRVGSRHVAASASSVRTRTRLYAALVKAKSQLTKARPR